MSASAPTVRPWILVGRSHRLWAIGLVLAALSLAVALSLGSDYGLADTDGTLTPLVRLLPIVGGAAVGLSVGSAAPDMECLGVRRLTVAVNIVVGVTTSAALAAVGLGLVAGSLAGGAAFPGRTFALLCIGTLAWAGVALLCASVVGANYAWAAPASLLAVVTLFGYDGGGRAYVWNVAGAAPSAGTVALAVGLYGAGVLLWNALRYRRWRAVP